MLLMCRRLNPSGRPRSPRPASAMSTAWSRASVSTREWPTLLRRSAVASTEGVCPVTIAPGAEVHDVQRHVQQFACLRRGKDVGNGEIGRAQAGEDGRLPQHIIRSFGNRRRRGSADDHLRASVGDEVSEVRMPVADGLRRHRPLCDAVVGQELPQRFSCGLGPIPGWLFFRGHHSPLNAGARFSLNASNASGMSAVRVSSAWPRFSSSSAAA